jgi:hypothetical protein
MTKPSSTSRLGDADVRRILNLVNSSVTNQGDPRTEACANKNELPKTRQPSRVEKIYCGRARMTIEKVEAFEEFELAKRPKIKSGTQKPRRPL